MSDWTPNLNVSVSSLYNELSTVEQLEALIPFRVNVRGFIEVVEKPLTEYITSGQAFSDPPSASLESLSKLDTLLAQIIAYGEEVKARTCVVCINEPPAKTRALNAEIEAQVRYVKNLQKVVDTTITSIKKTIDAERRR